LERSGRRERVVIIEHKLDVGKSAAQIAGLGSEGGERPTIRRTFLSAARGTLLS